MLPREPLSSGLPRHLSISAARTLSFASAPSLASEASDPIRPGRERASQNLTPTDSTTGADHLLSLSSICSRPGSASAWGGAVW
jgi:hypothetical protein